jgi:hypothetical protein
MFLFLTRCSSNNHLFNTHSVGTDNVSIRGDAGITKPTKQPKVLDTRTLPIAIPIDVLNDRNFSALEAIVRYLKEAHNLTYSQIAVMLQRDDRTIWTTYQRAAKKAKASEVRR